MRRPWDPVYVCIPTRRAEAAFCRSYPFTRCPPTPNLSGNPDEDYFADGMTDALITELAHTPKLRVVSHQGPYHDIWAISWLLGQSTGFHDHGESAGAFVVATGLLEEYRPGEQ
jgi:TolB-like protein